MSNISQNISNQEQAIRNFLRDYSNNPHDGEAICKILSEMCDYFDADRSYIFELNKERTHTSNTYEQCRDGVSAEIDNLQDIPVEGIEFWFEELEKRGQLYIPCLSEGFAPDSTIYRILNPQGIETLAAVPLIIDGSVAGFIGVDNPRRNTDHFLLLSVIAAVCCSEISNARLENTNRTLTERMKIIQSMSEIYTSVYYIDIPNNRYFELSSVDAVHGHIGSSGDAQERLDYFCRVMIVPEYTDELLEFVNISTLDERMKQERIVSKQFLCTVPLSEQQLTIPYWVQCSFIEGDRTNDGRLSHVIFATQTIHESKVKELETQKHLQEANSELTALLEAEKQHTAIIDSLSNVFFALYFIDIEQNVFREIFSPGGRKHTYGEKDIAKLRLKTAVDQHVNEKYRSAMHLFTDIDTIDERLGDSRIITQEYVSANGSWERCLLFPVEKNESGKNTKVIFGFRNITDEKEQLESQDNLIRALSAAYENVYAVNMESSECLCYRMGQAIKSRYGQEFATGDYEANSRKYIENDVLEEDRHLFDNVCTVDGLKKLFADKSSYSFSYRVSRNDKIQYFKCQLVKPDAQRNECVIGFKNVNDERQHELEQQTKVENALLKVEKMNKSLQDETDIAGALSRDYPDVVLLDFVNDTAVTIKRKGHIIAEEDRVARRSYYETWDYYLSTYVLEEDKEGLKKAIRIENVKKALEKSDEYSYSYRVMADDTGIHHYQASFIRFYSRQKTQDQTILGFRCIDAIVEEEHKNRAIQDEQLRIIGALSQEYSSLFKIDAKTRKMTLYRTDGVSFDPDFLNQLLALGDYEVILSKYMDTFVVPEDRDRLRESVGLSVLMDKVPDVGLYKLGYRRIKDGVISYFEMNLAKTVDQNGTVTFILGLRDVDEEARRQLKQTREMEVQREIIEGLGSEYYSVLLVDPVTDYVTVFRAESEDGKSIAKHFDRHNYCWSKGLYSYCLENVSDICRREFMEKLSLEHIREDGEDYSVTYEKLTSNGIIYLQARVAFVQKKDGGCVAVIGTRNVDDLIKKERQQEMALQAAYDDAEAANKAKTEFLSNMSHDIRTPMNGIIGMTAIAATHLDDTERVRDSLQKISQASKHMLSLINEVLDMSKIESGKVDLVEEEFNLSNLIDNLLSMTSEQISAHHHALSVNISGVTHEEVIGDSLRIQKVFTNLMSNAVKYTPDGGKISLSIMEKPSNYPKIGCYEFVFEDNGIGMSEEYLKNIFEPFSRASDSRVHKIQGTGLGMPISKNIVRMMGGDIKVESKLNVGSRFTVTMYLKLRDTEEISPDRFIDLNVLVADDDKLSLESCCGMLEDLGMKPDGVATGMDAVGCVIDRHRKNQDYFACIIDWKMPDMDGIATTKAIRKAVGKDVPIIIISAYDWSDIEQEARAAGANAFISKPLFRSRLEKTFSALVGEEQTEHDTPLLELSNMDFTGKRILLAEDNDLNAEIATVILGMTGLTVERAADGTQAVDMMNACEDGYYDLIFMDIQMPRMNGYDATRAIRAMNRSYCKQIPIIAMTANAFAEDVQAAKTVGMNEHIAKPLDMKVLAKTLGKWLV